MKLSDSDKKAFARLSFLVGAVLGGWIGGWAGAPFGVAKMIIFGVIGTGLGSAVGFYSTKKVLAPIPTDNASVQTLPSYSFKNRGIIAPVQDVQLKTSEPGFHVAKLVRESKNSPQSER